MALAPGCFFWPSFWSSLPWSQLCRISENARWGSPWQIWHSSASRALYTAKKMAFTVQKTRSEFTQNVAFAYIFWCSPIGKSKIFEVFCYRWIRVFVPLSGSFLLRWTPENARLLKFTGRLTLGECLVCLRSQMFSRCKTSRSFRVNSWKPAFSVVFQSAKCR